MVRSLFHGLNGPRHRRIPGDHDHFGVGIFQLGLFQHAHPIDFIHLEIGYHHIETALFEKTQRLDTAGCGFNIVPFLVKHILQV